MSNELISVIMPVHNGEKYLKEAIQGILAQNMLVEIIVIDDCSTDSSAEIAKEYNCKLITHKIQKGPVVAKNSGLKLAAGKYILFHDCDDIMHSSVLKYMYDEINSDKNIAAVEAKVQDFYSPDLPLSERNVNIKPEPYYGLFTGAILIRKKAFDLIGLFNENLKAGEIIDWQTRMNNEMLMIKKLDIVSTDRRIHSSNFGRTDSRKEFKDYAAILRAKLQAGKSFKNND